MIKKHFGFILIILVALIPLFNLLHPGLPVTHDGADHVGRIASFYQSLQDGNIIPRWAGDLNRGFGHPVLIFLYPLPSYIGAGFHFLGFSFVDSTKLVFAFGFIFSGLFMYLWLRKLLGEKPAIAGAVLYMFAPYRFIDLYVRGAIGENLAFVFLPMVLYFLYKLNTPSKNDKFNIVGVSIAFAGLILAHNVIGIMFLPFILVYIVYLYTQNKEKKRFAYIIAGLILGTLLASFFWVPVLLEGKYTLRDIVLSMDAYKRLVSLEALLYSPWNFGGTGVFSVQVGILQWISVICTPFLLFHFFKKKEKDVVLYLIIFSYFILSIFIMLPISTFLWQAITFLNRFQFPWRFLSISVFCSAALGAFVLGAIKNEKKQTIILIFVVVLALFFTKDYWWSESYFYRGESYYSGVHKTTTNDTGESSPIWSIRSMEVNPKGHIQVIYGKAKINEVFRNSVRHTYEIDSDSRVRIRENTLYFPGWTVYVDGKQNPDVEFQDAANRGIITFYVEAGKHTVDVVFKSTKIRQIADGISFVTIVILIALVAASFKSKKQVKTKIKKPIKLNK